MLTGYPQFNPASSLVGHKSEERVDDDTRIGLTSVRTADGGCHADLEALTKAQLLGDGCIDVSHFLQDAEIQQGLRLVHADPTRIAAWDSLIKDLPGVGFFHGAAWAAVLRDSYGFAPYYLALWTPAQILGVLPIMEVRILPRGRRGVALPFTDICPAIASNNGSLGSLVQAALEVGSSRKWRDLEIRGGDYQGKGGPGPSVGFHEHTIDLPGDPATVFSRVRPEVRTATRKAINCGLSVTMRTDLDSMRDFYQLYLLTRKKHGLPPQPFRFFKAIHRNILAKQSGIIAIAKRSGRPLAASVFLLSGGVAIFKFGASDPRNLSMRANDLVMWRAIEWCIERGITSLHLGRTSLNNGGLRRFKLGWGAREQSLTYYRRSCPTGVILPMIDRSRGWHTPVLRRLPLAVLRGLGVGFYRFAA